MFKLDSEEALLGSFRPRDRKALELPRDVKFPLFVRDYFAWTHPAGGHVYLVFSTPKGAPTGIAFDITRGGDPAAGRMCDWCHATGSADQIGLLTTDVNSRKRVGVYTCLDLSCAEKIQDAANRGGKSALDAVAALIEKMGRFASNALGIDLAGQNR